MRVAVLGVALALCGLVAGASLGAPGATAPKYSCVGNQVTLIDNTNGFAVDDGGTVPSFTTNGVAYCLTYIQTYHWNSGQGQLPGTLGLVRVNGPAGFAAKVGPFKAKSSAGQNNAPNVNWFVGVPPIPQSTIINGKYQCSDSGRSTWSSNKQSGGAGFCIVYAVKATPLTTTSGSTSTSTALTTTTTPTTTTGKAKKCACKGIGVKAGALTVTGKTFTLTYGWTVSCTTGTGGCSGSVKAGTVKVLGGLTPAPKTTFKLVKKTTSYKCTSLCTTSHSGTATVKGSASRAFTELNGRYLTVTFTLKCGKKSSKVTLSYRITTKPPPKVKACKCSSVKVALASKQSPIAGSTFKVAFAWTLKCVPGKGLPCTGTFAVGAPAGLTAVKKTAAVKCSGNCGKTKKGTAKVTFTVADPHALFGTTLAFPVTVKCGTKTSEIAVKVAVGATGKLSAG